MFQSEARSCRERGRLVRTASVARSILSPSLKVAGTVCSRFALSADGTSALPANAFRYCYDS